MSPLSPRPLVGIRVLDMATMLAAPTASTILADFGAEVVKLENPIGGDHSRRFGALKNGHGIYHKSMGRNKRSVAVDLHDAQIQSLVAQWISGFDVVIENFRPGTLERWNLAPAALLQRYPSLVVARVTGFGQDGPWRDRAGFGTLAEAMSGYASMTGYPDRPPVLPPAALADILTGTLCAAAVAAALMRAREQGTGEIIDAAIYEPMLRLSECAFMEYDQIGIAPVRSGNQSQTVAPRGAYQGSDGEWLVLSGSAQSIAERVLHAVGGDALRDDPRFTTNVERLQHNDELDALIAAWCSERSRDDAIRVLADLGCAVGPLETVASMLENVQVHARQSVVTVHDDDLGEIRMTNAYPRFERSEPPAIRPGESVIGEATRELFCEPLCLDEMTIDALQTRGAIVIPPAKG